MKDITRIHIAKVAYDIEVSAKKELEKYMAALSRYADDTELIDDIEIRFTELLAEHNVQAGGVITSDDVQSVRQQLGEPSDFAPESADEMIDSDSRERETPPRKLYRDRSAAVLGGVSAGIAQFFRIDPIWVRLIFVVLLIGSFGTVSVAYLILWLVVPPARTTAERLQMRGDAVTLESMKKLGDEMVETSSSTRTLRNIVRYVVGVGLLMAAIGTLIVTALVGATLFLDIGIDKSSPFSDTIVHSSWEATVSYVLFTISGLLLAALGFLLAHAVLTLHFVKRTAIAVVAIIVAGMVAFSVGVGILIATSTYNYQQAQEAVVTTKSELPAEFSEVKKLTVSAHAVDTKYNNRDAKIEYVADPRQSHYELTALPGLEPEIMIDGDEARIILKPNASDGQVYKWTQPKLVIRGPVLDEVEVEQGYFQYTGGYPDQQESLTISTLQMTEASVYGKYEKLAIDGSGVVDASQSSVIDLVIDMDSGRVDAGVVRSLDVSQRDVCSASGVYGDDNQVDVSGVSSGEMIYNGTNRDAETIRNECGSVVVDDNDRNEDWN